MQQRLTPASYNRKVVHFFSFACYFAYEIFAGAVLVAWDVVTPQLKARPGIVAVPLDAQTPAEAAIFANALSLTPGTISLDLSPDMKTLYVHAMFVDDPDKVRQDLKQGLERRLLALLRL
jgi:multicomponent Na+:H+ antiporter subunit E